MKKYDFNDFDKYTKKDKIYLIFYLIMLGISLSLVVLNAVVVALSASNYTSIAFLVIFSIILLFVSYLIFNYLIVPEEVLTLDYQNETITINNRLLPSITLNLKDIDEVRITDKKMIFNVVSLGNLYFVTKDKVYKAKYLISPKYLSITLNIYINVAKEGNKNA